MEENNLQVPLYRKWYDMTDEGIKKEDYRDINIYWARRLVYMLKDVLLHRHVPQFIDDKDAYNFLTCPQNNFGFKDFDYNIMTLGYPKKGDKSKRIKLEHKGIKIGYGNPEWGAEPNKLYFIIMHGDIIKE